MGRDKDGRMVKIQEDGTVGELVEYISSIPPKFLEHCFVKREQASAYNVQRERERAATESQSSQNALLQLDFSENYTCVSQDEVQSPHWNQRQVSLFTAALWYFGSLHSQGNQCNKCFTWESLWQGRANWLTRWIWWTKTIQTMQILPVSM